MDYSTETVLDQIERCESAEGFQELLGQLQSQQESWRNVVNELLSESGRSVSSMAEACGVSRQAVMKWQKGSIPKSRDMFIRIAMAAGYSLEQVNSFLKKYGRCPELYAKTLEDAVYIFLLSSDEMEHSYRSFQQIREEIKLSMDMTGDTDMEQSFETGAYLQLITGIRSVPQLTAFIEEHAKVFKRQYRKLYAYIRTYIESSLLTEEGMADQDSVYALAERQQWSASLRRSVSEINNHKWYPQRNKLISLGIHLNMDIEHINYMLSLAHMSELYAKNPFEGSILFALNCAEIEDFVDTTGTDLCWYVKKILEDLHYSDIEFFLEELSEGQEDGF